MKFVIMTYGDLSDLEGRSPEWIEALIDFMKRIDVELEEAGELVFQQGLADAATATTVTVPDGTPVTAAGSPPAVGKPLAGFWVVDVKDEARAIEIAARISAVADAPIEVRQAMDAPPPELD